MGLSNFRLFSCIALLAAFGFACSNSKLESAEGGAKQPSDKEEDEGKDDKTDTSTGGSISTEDDPPGGSTTGSGGDDDEDEELGPTTGCGSGEVDQTIQSANIPFHGFAGRTSSTEYNIIVKGTLSFQSSGKSLTTTTRFDLISADPSNAAKKAKEEINKVTGTRTTTAGTGDALPCSVFPVTRIVEQTGTHTTTTEFSPEMPYFISPSMSKARFNKEFPSAKTFDGLRVTVSSTTNDTLENGQSASGSVTITPVSPETTVTDAGSQSISADYAYKIEFNFGDHETVAKMGMYKVATYYVKDGKFALISVETGVKDTPVAHYISN